MHDHLPKDSQAAFFQQVFMLCEMQANIQRLYIAGEWLGPTIRHCMLPR